MAVTQCRHFSGYKPCGFNEICDSHCPSKSIPTTHLLVIHLEALGAVLRGTSILPAIKRKFPSSHITWVTQRPAQDLLLHNPHIDRVITSDDIWTLRALHFDATFCVDKSLRACGILASVLTDLIFGFKADPSGGAILPATSAAQELWELGLDDQKKFFVNQKPETQLMAEALELAFLRDEYVLNLSVEEKALALQRNANWGNGSIIVGINTGCAATMPAKKLSIEGHRQLIGKLSEIKGIRLVLLGGGKEDWVRNQAIGKDLDVQLTPCEQGLRDGLVSVAACDIVISGDSLGMHMAIALSKWVVAWFGPSCLQEIDLYGRGVALKTEASCSPCWKRSCQKNPMCYDLVDFDRIARAVKEGIHWCHQSKKNNKIKNWPEALTS